MFVECLNLYTRGGAWMDVCIGKSDACKRDIPVAYLTCNGSPPVGDKPSLMTFREVETLFHGKSAIMTSMMFISNTISNTLRMNHIVAY